jgi:hypothetical protein
MNRGLRGVAITLAFLVAFIEAIASAEVLPVSHGECRGSLCSSYPTLTEHRILQCDQHGVCPMGHLVLEPIFLWVGLAL